MVLLLLQPAIAVLLKRSTDIDQEEEEEPLSFERVCFLLREERKKSKGAGK